ncbi:MAG: hypothetical protein ABEK42_02270, partial [Thiohalorhabdaceae bacterium]
PALGLPLALALLPVPVAADGTDVPRELFPLMVDLPGFSGPPADGSRVVMSGQLALSVTRRYRAVGGDARVTARVQASSAMAGQWQGRVEASARQVRLAGLPAVVEGAGAATDTRVTVRLGTSPVALFVLETSGLGRTATLELARRFPLAAMQAELGGR